MKEREREHYRHQIHPPYGSCHCSSAPEVGQKPQKSPKSSLVTHKNVVRERRPGRLRISFSTRGEADGETEKSDKRWQSRQNGPLDLRSKSSSALLMGRYINEV